MRSKFAFKEIIIREEDPYKRGYKYGEETKQEVREQIKKWYAILENTLHITEQELLTRSRIFWPFIQEYSETISREIEGIADGSGSKLDEIVMLNAINEFFVNGGPKNMGYGCTSFAVSGDATSGGETYVVQNDDWKPWAAELGIIIRFEMEDVKILSFSFAGSLPIIGLNSHGIALCINSLRDGKVQPGVPVSVITRDILQQKTIGQALHSISRASRATSVNLLLGDKNGELYDMEITKDKYAALYGQNSIAHTNHFLSRDLLASDSREKDFALLRSTSTIVRYNRIKKLINKNYGTIDKQKVKEFLSDHVNYPESICSHPRHGKPARTESITIASFIMKPEENVMLVADGNPCQREFQRFKI